MSKTLEKGDRVSYGSASNVMPRPMFYIPTTDQGSDDLQTPDSDPPKQPFFSSRSGSLPKTLLKMKIIEFKAEPQQETGPGNIPLPTFSPADNNTRNRENFSSAIHLEQ